MSIINFIITFSAILILVFLISAFLFLKKAKTIKSKKIVKEKKEGFDFGQFKERWQAVLGHIDLMNESDWKLAIIEADKLVDDLLIQKGYKGESMAERLASVEKDELSSIDLLWEAHKVRNRIAHKVGFKLTNQEADKVISYYKEALEELIAKQL